MVRPLTDCFNDLEGPLVGDFGVDLAQVRFYNELIRPAQQEEIMQYGDVLARMVWLSQTRVFFRHMYIETHKYFAKTCILRHTSILQRHVCRAVTAGLRASVGVLAMSRVCEQSALTWREDENKGGEEPRTKGAASQDEHVVR